MKRAIFCTVISAFLFITLTGQTDEERDANVINDFVRTRIRVTSEQLVSDTLSMVLTGTFYRAVTAYVTADMESTCTENLLVLKDGEVIEFDNRTDSMLMLLSLVRKDFYIKTEADAVIMEAVLNKLFPVSSFSEPEDIERIKIGNDWYFIRGTFFDSKSGYIVSLDEESGISNIAYSLEAIKNE